MPGITPGVVNTVVSKRRYGPVLMEADILLELLKDVQIIT